MGKNPQILNRLSSSKPLSGGKPANLSIIFVHALNVDSRRFHKEIRRRLRKLDGSPSVLSATIYEFGFRAITLMQEGEARFIKLSNRLQNGIVELLEKNPSCKFVIVGLDLAGWIIEKALTTYSFFTTSVQFSSVIGVIFWDLPEIQHSGWREFTQRFRGPSGKPLAIALGFSTIGLVTQNFHALTELQHLGPIVQSSTLKGVALTDRITSPPLLRRATSILTGSSSTSSQIDAKKSITAVLNSMSKSLEEGVKLIVQKERSVKVPLDNITSAPKKAEMTPIGRGEILPKLQLEEPQKPQSGSQARQSVSTMDSKTPPPERHPKFGMTIDYNSQTCRYPRFDRPGFSVFALFVPSNNNEHVRLQDKDVYQMAKNAGICLRDWNISLARSISEDLWSALEDEIDDGRRVIRRWESLPQDFILNVKIQAASLSVKEGQLYHAQLALEWLQKEIAEVPEKIPSRFWPLLRELGYIYYGLGEYQKSLDTLTWAGTCINARIDDARKFEEKDVQVVAYSHLLMVESLRSLVMAHLGETQDALTLSEWVIRSEAWPSVIQLETENRAKNTRVIEISPLDIEIRSTRAEVLLIAGYWERARSLSEEVTDHMRALFGRQHTRTHEHYIFHARMLLAGGDIRGAEKLCLEALERLEESLAHQHPLILDALDVEITILILQGRLTEAHSRAGVLIKWSNTKLGNIHPQTLSAYNKLALIHAAKGDLSTAMDLQRFSVERWRETMGNRHPKTMSNRACLARVLLDARYIAESRHIVWDIYLDLYQLTGELARLGPLETDHTRIDIRDCTRRIVESTDERISQSSHWLLFCDLLECLAIAEREDINGNIDIATRGLQRVVKIREGMSPAQGVDLPILGTLHELAVTERMRDDLEAALNHSEETLTRTSAVLGPNHQRTLLAKFERKYCDFLLGKTVNIQELYAALGQLDRMLGEDHPDTVKMRSELALVMGELNYLEEAEELQSKALRAELNMMRGLVSKDATGSTGRKVSLKGQIPFTSSSKTTGNGIQDIVTELHGLASSSSLSKPPVSRRLLLNVENLAHIACGRKDFGTAIAIQNPLVQLLQALDVPSPQRLSATHDLGHMYQLLADQCEIGKERDGLYSKATSVYQSVLDDLDNQGQNDTFLYRAAQANVASIMFSLGLLDEAQQIQEDIIARLSSKSDLADKELLIDSIFNVSLTIKALGDVEKARMRLHEALHESNTNFGMHHPRTVELLDSVAEWGSAGL